MSLTGTSHYDDKVRERGTLARHALRSFGYPFSEHDHSTRYSQSPVAPLFFTPTIPSLE